MQDSSGQPNGDDQPASTGQDYNHWVASFQQAYSKNQFQGAQYYAAPGQMPPHYANMWGAQQGQYAGTYAFNPAGYPAGQAYPYSVGGSQPGDPAAYARALQQGQGKNGAPGEAGTLEGQPDPKTQVGESAAGSDGGSVSEAPQMPPGAVQPAYSWRPAAAGGHVVDYSTAMAAGLVDEREAKRQKRKQSNRESARRSRLRKQAECEELGKRVQTLTTENLDLRKSLTELHASVTSLQSSNTTLREQVVSAGGECPPEPVLPKLTIDPANLAPPPPPIVLSKDDDEDDKGSDDDDDDKESENAKEDAPAGTSEKEAEK